MRLFHGTSLENAKKILKHGILLSESNPYTDFGRGFYTANEEYASTTALFRQKKSRKNQFVPAVVELEFDEEKAKQLNVLSFESENLEWLQFIMNNRLGLEYIEPLNEEQHNLAARFDIVKGRVADGKLVVRMNEIKNELRHINWKDVEDVKYKNKPEAYQISFHTPEALQTLTVISYHIVEEV